MALYVNNECPLNEGGSIDQYVVIPGSTFRFQATCRTLKSIIDSDYKNTNQNIKRIIAKSNFYYSKLIFLNHDLIKHSIFPSFFF